MRTRCWRIGSFNCLHRNRVTTLVHVCRLTNTAGYYFFLQEVSTLVPARPVFCLVVFWDGRDRPCSGALFRQSHSGRICPFLFFMASFAASVTPRPPARMRVFVRPTPDPSVLAGDFSEYVDQLQTALRELTDRSEAALYLQKNPNHLALRPCSKEFKRLDLHPQMNCASVRTSRF